MSAPPSDGEADTEADTDIEVAPTVADSITVSDADSITVSDATDVDTDTEADTKAESVAAAAAADAPPPTVHSLSLDSLVLNNVGAPIGATTAVRPRVLWRVARHTEPDPLGYVDHSIGSMLSDRRPAFKIGITHDPLLRMSARFPDYSHRDRLMVICLMTMDRDIICAWEVAAIARHRRYGPLGVHRDVRNPNVGHPACRNRSPGGEFGHDSLPPFFLYVVFGNRYNWHCDASRSRSR